MKNYEEMTFKEYWEEKKRKGKDAETIENNKNEILKALREEGFTDEQINEMKMRKIKNLCLDALVPVFDRLFGDITFLEKLNPDLVLRFQPHLKKLRKEFEELNKDLEEKLRRQNIKEKKE